MITTSIHDIPETVTWWEGVEVLCTDSHIRVTPDTRAPRSRALSVLDVFGYNLTQCRRYRHHTRIMAASDELRIVVKNQEQAISLLSNKASLPQLQGLEGPGTGESPFHSPGTQIWEEHGSVVGGVLGKRDTAD